MMVQCFVFYCSIILPYFNTLRFYKVLRCFPADARASNAQCICFQLSQSSPDDEIS